MLNVKKLFIKILAYFAPLDGIKITTASAPFNGNNYASLPASANPGSEYSLLGVLNSGFQANPRWITSFALQNSTWVLHADTTVPGSISVTCLWIKTSYFS